MFLHKTHVILSLLFVATLISTTGFVLWSHLYYQTGYPLDDAWIYQTYARNLAQLGEWSFIPGEVSGGSTGPLWVLFLTFGYWVRLDHHLWSNIIGSFVLFSLGVLGMRAIGNIYPEIKKYALLAGLILVFEWHLVWAAVSGMETLLSALIITTTLVFLFRGELTDRIWLLIGFLIGFCLWIRPDGITLLGPAGFVLLFGSKNPLAVKIKQGFYILLGLAIPASLYLLFNQITSGTVWPNTFFAKQAEYAEYGNIPFCIRYARQWVAPLTGVGIALLPGFFFLLIKTIIARRWALTASYLWFFGYLAMYAWRLPVTYQHGRYVIPAMPIFLILGLAGMLEWAEKHWKDGRMIFRILSKVWVISCICLTALFWGLGAKAYAEDVAIIESEMVTTAQWLRRNTNPNALIAAHDIGAVGYFAERQLVDLAGLISPDVIPFLRDEIQLTEYLNEQKVDYLMTFPQWYPSLTSRSERIFQTEGIFSPQFGGENMAVFKWDSGEGQK